MKEEMFEMVVAWALLFVVVGFYLFIEIVA